MIARRTTSIPALRVAAAFVLAAIGVVSASCSKVPLLAPSGAIITLTSGATALSIGGSTTLTAQVLEQGGTAPQDGTTVTFTTTLGSVEPASAQTKGGQATVTFRAGNASGTATITASSGGAS